MGNETCNTPEQVDLSNRCDISVGERIPLRNFCTYVDDHGDSIRAEYCSLISSGNEWGNSQQGDDCDFTTCFPYTIYTNQGQCCQLNNSSCCRKQGKGVTCQRIKFTGDPLTCCLKDMACSNIPPSSNPNQCYSDELKQHTCSDGKNGQPNYRSIVSKDCREFLYQYCTGTLPTDDPNSNEWLNRWTKKGRDSCVSILVRNIIQAEGPRCFDPPVNPGICTPIRIPLDAEGYFWAQGVITKVLQRYQEQGFSIGTPPSYQGYNIFQDLLYSEICCPYPGLCQPALRNICSDKTAQRLSLNLPLMQWCGCHLPSNEYQNYSIKYNILPQCTPMCNRQGVIPIVGINSEPITCQQNICIIDEINVNLINSQVGVGIEFDQVCGNCKNSQCSCIISNATIDINNSTINGNFVPISEGCGNFFCTQDNSSRIGPLVITTQCGDNQNPLSNLQQRIAKEEKEAQKRSWIYTIIIIGIFLLILFFLVFFINPKS